MVLLELSLKSSHWRAPRWSCWSCLLKVLIGGHPDGLVGVVYDDLLDLLVDVVDVVTLDDGCEVLHELAFQPDI